VEYANAKAVLWQFDVQPADETGGRCRTGPRRPIGVRAKTAIPFWFSAGRVAGDRLWLGATRSRLDMRISIMPSGLHRRHVGEWLREGYIARFVHRLCCCHSCRSRGRRVAAGPTAAVVEADHGARAHGDLPSAVESAASSASPSRTYLSAGRAVSSLGRVGAHAGGIEERARVASGFPRARAGAATWSISGRDARLAAVRPSPAASRRASGFAVRVVGVCPRTAPECRRHTWGQGADFDLGLCFGRTVLFIQTMADKP
jgi:hypothetical protein